MITRRRFLESASLLAGELLLGCGRAAAPPAGAGEGWFMPGEGASHKRTWMAFGASRRIWGRRLLPEARRNLAALASSIAQFEPVSMLVREEEADLASRLAGPSVELLACPLDDLWMRDTGPVFLLDGHGRKAAVDFNFNGWGRKQPHGRDAAVAAFVARHAGVPVLSTGLVLEGGGIEVDGRGTALVTESCVLNGNRNPGMTRTRFEETLMPLLGLDKIIWLPGVRGREITDGHTDFYARFARPGVVVAGLDPDPASYDHGVTRRHLEILRAATDARGNTLTVIPLEGPASIRPAYATRDFAAGYAGYYVCNGAVIVQEFGDPRADQAARQALQGAFPGREVVPIATDAIAAGGGSVHCTTQQEPEV